MIGHVTGIVLYINNVDSVINFQYKSYCYYNCYLFYLALGTQVMIILHICWGVLFFAGWEKRNWFLVIAVPLTHMMISCLVRTVTVTCSETSL